jgi:hypothetical protein
VGFLKPRPKLTFGWVQDCHSYLDSATPISLTHPTRSAIALTLKD